jgi:hypothetical protein
MVDVAFQAPAITARNEFYERMKVILRVVKARKLMSAMGRKQTFDVPPVVQPRMKAMMDDAPEQKALFQIEGPDEDGCVWICSAEGGDVWPEPWTEGKNRCGVV